jgi:NitT/TauT family transport system substrate-binding protein
METFMSISRRDILKLAGATGALSVAPSFVRASALEKKAIHIAVGGESLVYYLPLTIANINGYFKQEGLEVKVSNFAGGSKALQAVVGGSADVVSGAYEHTINLQSKAQMFQCVVLQGRAPMIVVGVSTKTMPDYKTPADFKGKRIGVTAPGSSTSMLFEFFLAKHGLKGSDVSFVGVGAGAGAVSAVQSGQVDAIVNLDPVISILEANKSIKVILDTRTIKDTIDVFGGNMPAGCLYLSNDYIAANPNTTQAMVNAMVRADKWIQANGADGVVKVVPESYLLGNPEVYKLSVQRSLEGLSPNGLMPADGPETALRALAEFKKGFDPKSIDLAKTWTNTFAEKANQKYA